MAVNLCLKPFVVFRGIFGQEEKEACAEPIFIL